MPYPRQELDIVEDTSIGAWFATSKPVPRAAMLANVFRFETKVARAAQAP